GADQGGSIRIPAALSGALGLKPTYGLVPYTGIFPIENSIDHVGPICRTAADAALLLEVIAGLDPLDPRQRFTIPEVSYTQEIHKDLHKVSIGIVTEGFGWDPVGAATDAIVKAAAARFTDLGATVKNISIPMHRDGIHIYTPILMEGGAMQMVRGNGFGVGWK